MIESDPRLKKFLLGLRERPVLNSKGLTSDAENLLRQVPTVRLGRHDMQDKRLQLAAFRSRLVHIKVQLMKEHSYLVGARRDVEDWLYARYSNYLRAVNNEKGRSALINRALAPLDRRIRPLRDAMDVVELVLHDYDSRAFSFRDLVSAMRLGDRET